MNLGLVAKVFQHRTNFVIGLAVSSLLHAGSGLAQDAQVVVGRIIHAETQGAVPFASVGIPGRQIGTSANLDGFFELETPPPTASDTLVVSCVGFERYVIPVEDLNRNVMNILQLTPKTILLEEVVVREESLNAEEIVRKASKELKTHLRTTPYLVGARYREYIKVKGQYKGFTEAIGVLYMGGYNRQYNSFKNRSYTYDLAQWKHIRRSKYDVNLGNSRPDYLFADKLIKTKDFYIYGGPVQRSQISKFDYFIDSLTNYDDHLVYLVSFKPRSDYQSQITFEGTILIKSDDYAVLGMEIHDHSSHPILGLNKRSAISNNFSFFNIRLAEFDGKYYLSYVKQFNSYEVEVEGEPVKTEEVLELIGGKFLQSRPQELNYGQRTVLFSEMENPLINYDPEFWEASKMSEVPQAAQLQRDLAPDESFETQFSKNSGKRIVPIPDGFSNYQDLFLNQETFDIFFPN